MNHKQKTKIAKKGRTKNESKNKVPIFQTKFWEERKLAIIKRVLRTQNKKKEKYAKIQRNSASI